MSLPNHLQQTVDSIWAEVQNHPDHTSSIFLRKRLYDQINELEEPLQTAFRSQLALLTARRVFPLIEQHPPNFELDWESIEDQDAAAVHNVNLVRSVLTALENFDTTDEDELEDLIDELYNSMGNWETAPKGCAVGNAVYKAYYEVSQGYSLPDEDQEAPYGVYQAIGDFPDDLDEDAEELVDVDWEPIQEDVDLASLAAFGDVAGSAATAWGLLPDSDVDVDPQAMLAFWQWWHLEAIPQAWALAQGR